MARIMSEVEGFLFRALRADEEAAVEDEAISEFPRVGGYLSHRCILSMNVLRMSRMLTSWPVRKDSGDGKLVSVPITKETVSEFYLEHSRFCESILAEAAADIERQRKEIRGKFYAGSLGGKPA
jgi:hypothetical protein